MVVYVNHTNSDLYFYRILICSDWHEFPRTLNFGPLFRV
jgi:hypothetical protein